ncbi:MAG: DNA polymerase III subunit alpha [Bacteroidales bacterium]
MSGFVHLHVHTQYSILDGASNISALIAKAKNDGMPAVAITDHGNMFGVKEFVNEANKQGIKPVIGCEVYVATRSRTDRTDKEDRSSRHLILLAKNLTGYHNLAKLVSLGYVEGFYYKPRIDKELLRQYHDGLIASSACLGGEVPELFFTEGETAAENAILEYADIFGKDFYLELQRHFTGDPQTDSEVFDRQQKVNEFLARMAKKHGIGLIATNDVHFVNAEDAEAHDRLICLNTNAEIDDPDRLRYTKQEYFKTTAEMAELFADFPEALENTVSIAEQVESYSLERDPVMPHFPLPEGFTDDNEYLRHLTYEGAARLYGEIDETIRARIDYELGVIKKMGYPGYFLIVWDFLRAAREMGVAVGPGRGSAAGSVVAYCLRITDIDPLKYGLLFERFLNPDRISLPDIDIDFDEDGREQVLQYVVQKYGKDKVAHVITFGTMAARMAIRDVARIQKLSLQEADRLAKLVPERPGVTLKKAYEEVKELNEARKSSDPLVRQTLRFAETLEGSVRHTGLHACGIIIGRENLMNYIPVCTSKDTDLLVTQFEGSHIESVGMLKMDFLGLKTLSIIRDAIANIKASTGKEIDIEHIPLDDRETFELFSRGDTTAIFQFESSGMKKWLRELKPNRFEDLIAMNALYRPGPMEYIPHYVARKHGREKITYDFPVMESVLKETYGITVYQEQVMRLSQIMAGFTGGEADSLRKAMGKKNKKIMDQLREKFLAGCAKNGLNTAKAEKVWTDWEAFAQYAFNKSHSTCYAYVAYQTAWLKAHYPAEFMAAVLSRNLSDIKKITQFMDECRRMGISVLGPDVNESNLNFTVTPRGDIRFGLAAIKGMGEAAAASVIEERNKNGLFKDIYHFVERVSLSSLNRKNMEALAYAGAFDNLQHFRREQYFAPMEGEREETFIEALLRYGNKIQIEKNSTQKSLFGEAIPVIPSRPRPPEVPEWSTLEKLGREKELIGVYLSAHPLDNFKVEIEHFTNCTLSELKDLEHMRDKELAIAGLVIEAREGMTKTNNPYGTFTIEDYTDSFRIALFGRDYVNWKNFLTVGYALFIKGKIQPRGYGNNPDELEFKVNQIYMLSQVRDELVHQITIRIPIEKITDEFLTELGALANGNKGKVELKFSIFDPADNLVLEMFSRNKRIALDNAFFDYLQELEVDFRLK